MKEKGIILGYKRGTAKNGNTYCIVKISHPFDDYMKGKGWVGNQTSEIFCPDNAVNDIQPPDIGKEIEIEKAIAGDRVVIKNITVIRK